MRVVVVRFYDNIIVFLVSINSLYDRGAVFVWSRGLDLVKPIRNIINFNFETVVKNNTRTGYL